MIRGEYANVIVDISHEKVDRPFMYRIPSELSDRVEEGSCVTVPFGRGNTLRKAYVVQIKEEPEIEPEKIKSIAGISEKDQGVDELMMRLAAWMRRRYGSTMIAALKTVLPAREKVGKLKKREVIRLWSAEECENAAETCEQKHQSAKARVLRELQTEELLPEDLLIRKLHISRPTLLSLEKQGAVEIREIEYYRNPVSGKEGKGVRHPLSEEQQAVVDGVLSDFDAGIKKTYLLHGITGAGKTEVYMDLIEGCIERGRQAIVLIPEIALTYQTLLRFYKRFGDRVSVLNSTLSAGEKYDQCMRARNGEIDVIIGPRSALFTPFPKVGLIVIDEEHETTYKSEGNPRYHARETAIYLAGLHGASVVLGSATPSVDTYYKAQNGEYGYFRLTKRLTGGALPEVHISDMREELRAGNKSMFSRKLQELMEERLSKKEQIMLFLNRRGYAGFISCRSCGEVLKCPHCDVSLSEHRGGKLICHYCGYETPTVKLCPKCGSKYISGFRAGTQQVEEKLRQMYPQARVLRMDADTTKTKDSYETILEAFSSGEADILVGTQMIVKGHDFPNVTLVGALAADMSLFASDFRSAERTFELLTQAAGRAGRGEKKGEVVIQTYQPEHYGIVTAAAQDYEAFYEEEMEYRDLGGYPPAAHLMAVLVTAPNEDRAEEAAKTLADLTRKRAERNLQEGRGRLFVIGPAEATIAKINDVYRRVFYIKGSDLQEILNVREVLEAELESPAFAGDRIPVTAAFDLDPMYGF
ncbi:MAG: primosomal protein N' [Lachnospiraceae bacterium]|nr:primosomal protein N' [Lachnospiraceae bacterium]